MGRWIVLAAAAAMLAGCADNRARDWADTADANARQALRENGQLRSRLDELEARVDELEAKARK